MISVGLDLSLTSSGIAVVDTEQGSLHTELVKSSGKKTDDLTDMVTRVEDIASRIIEYVDSVNPDIIAVETAFFSTANDVSAHRRAGAWWMTMSPLLHKYSVIEVTPSTLKIFATEKGNAKKGPILESAISIWGDEQFVGAGKYDRADASFLALIGAWVTEQWSPETMPVTDNGVLRAVEPLKITPCLHA